MSTRTAWVLAFVAVAVLAGSAAAAPAEPVQTQAVVSLAEIFSPAGAADPAPAPAEGMALPEPIALSCSVGTCRQPCIDICADNGCWAICISTSSCECACKC